MEEEVMTDLDVVVVVLLCETADAVSTATSLH